MREARRRMLEHTGEGTTRAGRFNGASGAAAGTELDRPPVLAVSASNKNSATCNNYCESGYLLLFGIRL